MSRKWLRRTAVVVALALLVLLAVPVSDVRAAARQYTALGDSISYGLTDLSGAGGYVGLYADWLGKRYTMTNLSYPGDTTQDLLNTIAANESLIKKSQILTVSIGSNNLLGPFIASILDLYDIDPADYPGDLNGAMMLGALYEQIHLDWLDGGETPAQRLARLIYPIFPEFYELNATLAAGTAMFALHWPVILTRIRLRAPLAKLYVNNLYNPLLMSKTYDDGIGIQYLYDSVDAYMGRINANITRYASLYRYKIVDVYGPFTAPASYAGYVTNPFSAPLTFNIPAALMIASGANPAYPYPSSFEAFFFACDPHPTTVGHTIIFEALKSLS